MNNQTKILVIHMKELIIGVIIAIILIIITILAIVCLGRQNDNTPATSTKAASTNTYIPGVYTSSISVNGTPVEIQVTVDSNNINSIELKNLSESVTTMYPLMQNSFDELVSQIISNGSTTNISYNAENKYTSTILLNGIQQALDKCTK